MVPKAKAERTALMAKINHDLYLEGITKNDFENQMDQKFINGEITLEERKILILQHTLGNKYNG